VHVARPQRTNGALEDPTALPQCSVEHGVQTPYRGVYFEHAQNNAAAWRSRRLYSTHTAHTQCCWRLHSAHIGKFLKRCGNAIRTPLRGFNNSIDFKLHVAFNRLLPYHQQTITNLELSHLCGYHSAHIVVNIVLYKTGTYKRRHYLPNNLVLHFLSQQHNYVKYSECEPLALGQDITLLCISLTMLSN